MKPLVSVIIPTYNRSHLVERAIKSVQGQSVVNIEIIVCDDGSTDNTLNTITKLGEVDSRIKYLILKHSGLPATARNAGIKAASGEWITFLDSDDVWEQNKLATQLKLSTQIKAALYCSNAKLNSSNSEYFDNSSSRYINLHELIKDNPIITSSVMVRRDVLVKLVGFTVNPELKAVEDYELWLEISSHWNIYYQKETILTYTSNSLDSIRKSFSDQDVLRKFVFSEFLANITKKSLKIDPDLLSDLIKYQNTPIISVIIPTKDTKSLFLVEAVKSILDQTFPDFELIIVDDGSVVPVLKKLSKIRDTRIKIIRNNVTKGISYSLNKAISLAQGRYIARMDADDIAKHSRLKEQKDYLDNHPNINILGSWTEVFGDQNYVRKTTLSPEEITIEMLFRCPIAHPSVMMRSSIFSKGSDHYDQEFDTAEDYELWSRYIKEKTIANIGEVLLQYRTHSGQIGKKNELTQNTISDKIRNNLLHKLIPSISELEIKIHNKIAKYQISSKDNPINIASCLVKVVFEGTRNIGVNNSSKIKRVLLESYPIITRLNYLNKLVYSVLILYLLFIRVIYEQ